MTRTKEQKMRPFRLALLLLGLAAPMMAAQAQVPGASPDVGPPIGATSSDAATLAAFGGEAGLRRVVDRGIDRVVANPVIGARFQGANLPQLKQRLGDQFCALLGGPCQYAGADMVAAHRGMNIRLADFNALVEEFQRAMDEQGIAYFYQTRLIAKLAPMQREMVGR